LDDMGVSKLSAEVFFFLKLTTRIETTCFYLKKKCCSFELSIHQRILKKCIMFFTK